MPSSTSYPRVALPSVACDLLPAMRPSAPTRRLCGPGLGAAGSLLLTRAVGTSVAPGHSALCAARAFTPTDPTHGCKATYGALVGTSLNPQAQKK